MPLARISVPAGSLTVEARKKMVTLVTDAIVEAEGVKAIKPYVTVLIDEIPEGGWGIAGQGLTLAEIRNALTKAA